MCYSLETERLYLRPWRDQDSDIDAYYAMNSDPEVIRHVGNRPMAAREAAQESLRQLPLRDYPLYAYGRLAVELKS